MTQQMLTYGLSRSPTRAHFQNIPITLEAGQPGSKNGDRCVPDATDPILHLIPSSRRLGPRLPFFPLVHQGREYGVNVCRCADEKENDEQEALEVEERGL